MAAANQEMSGDSTEQVGAVMKCLFHHEMLARPANQNN